MTGPLLRVGASGFGGSGYAIPTWPTEDGKPTKVPGVTTVLNAIDKPGIRQWAVDQTAAYAVANQEALAYKDDEDGYKYLRFYHARKFDFDDPTVDLRNYHIGALDDLANLGTLIHTWIEEDLTGGFEPEIVRREQEQMVIAYLEWKADQDIEHLYSEHSVVNKEDGHAGTFDHIMVINGVRTLVDVKSSRAVHTTHESQLAALRSSKIMMKQVAEDAGIKYTSTIDKVKRTTYWAEEETPEVEQCAVLQVRPDDSDNNGNFIPSFCKLHIIPEWKLDTGYERFMGALKIKQADFRHKQLEKEFGSR